MLFSTDISPRTWFVMPRGSCSCISPSSPMGLPQRAHFPAAFATTCCRMMRTAAPRRISAMSRRGSMHASLRDRKILTGNPFRSSTVTNSLLLRMPSFRQTGWDTSRIETYRGQRRSLRRNALSTRKKHTFYRRAKPLSARDEHTFARLRAACRNQRILPWLFFLLVVAQNNPARIARVPGSGF